MSPPAPAYDDEVIVVAHGSLAALAFRGEQRVIARGGHLMHADAADAIVAAVQDAIETIK